VADGAGGREGVDPALDAELVGVVDELLEAEAGFEFGKEGVSGYSAFDAGEVKAGALVEELAVDLGAAADPIGRG
jgi:hypothetical protein